MGIELYQTTITYRSSFAQYLTTNIPMAAFDFKPEDLERLPALIARVKAKGSTFANGTAENSADRQSRKGSVTNFTIRCKNGHQFRATITKLLAGHFWCAECTADSKGYTIDKCVALAAERGGKCLSEKYLNDYEPLRWECARGHTWSATFNNVSWKGTWCSVCSTNAREQLVKIAMEEATGQRFPKSRPDFLQGLELDGFNGTDLAFEHQGIQHTVENTKFFHRKKGAFEEQVERDNRKRDICAQRGIAIIEISYSVKPNKIRTFVRDALAALGKELLPLVGTEDEFYNKCRALDAVSVAGIENLTATVTKKGGEVLSDHYASASIPVRIKCPRGHYLSATPAAIKRSRDSTTERGLRMGCTLCSIACKPFAKKLRESNPDKYIALLDKTAEDYNKDNGTDISRGEDDPRVAASS